MFHEKVGILREKVTDVSKHLGAGSLVTRCTVSIPYRTLSLGGKCDFTYRVLGNMSDGSRSLA